MNDTVENPLDQKSKDLGSFIIYSMLIARFLFW